MKIACCCKRLCISLCLYCRFYYSFGNLDLSETLCLNKGLTSLIENQLQHLILQRMSGDIMQHIIKILCNYLNKAIILVSCNLGSIIVVLVFISLCVKNIVHRGLTSEICECCDVAKKKVLVV